MFLYLAFSFKKFNLKIIVSVNPSDSLTLHQDKNTFQAMYPEDKKELAENWISEQCPH